MIRFIQNNNVLNSNLKVIYILFLSFILYTHQLYGQTTDFNFNKGSTQNWTLYGPQNSQGTILTSNFSSITWSNSTNYPNAIGADPISDSSGSVSFSCYSGTGIVDSDTWWIMQFVSPDLSSNTDWQKAKGYSVQLAENMSYASQTSLYANLYVKVHDNDLNSDRYYYNSAAQLLTRNQWNSLSFDWSGISNFPTNYTIVNIFIDIWGTIIGHYSGSVYLDEVKLVSGVPGKPVLLSPNNYSIDNPVNPTLQWQAVPGATYYDLRVFTEGGNLILHDPTVTSTSRQISSLDYSSTYIWLVAAGNKYGLGVTSNPFRFTTISAPVLLVSPPNQDVPYNSGSTTFTVTSNVSWNVNDDASWLTISPPNGTGNGTITASFPENNTGQRTGTITVKGGGITRTVTVTQAVLWVGPTVSTSSISDITANSATGGGNVTSQGSTPVTSRGICWSISQNPTISNSKTIEGSGTGSFTSLMTGLSPSTKYYVKAYAINSIGAGYGQQVEFTTQQEYILTINPANQNVNYTSGSTTFTVTSNVSWSVSDNASWLSVSPVSGSGNSTLTATYTENTTTVSRVGTITIKDSGITRTVTVTQAAGPVRLTVTPSDRPVPYTSGSTTFTVTSNVNWSSSDDVSWLTLNLSGGTGNATLIASYTENTAASQRTATITVTGGIPGYTQLTRTVTVTQAGKPTLTVTPSDRQVSNNSGSVPFYVTSNVSWNVTDHSSWLTVSPISGSGNGTLTATYSANSSGDPRVGTITVTDGEIVNTVSVTQSGTELYVSPANRSVSNTSGKTSFTVTSNASWSVSDNVSWLTVSPTKGSGNGTLDAAFTENISANERTGTITVTSGGIIAKATVTQAPAPLLITSPFELHVSYLSGSTTFTIISNVSWNITDNASWLTINPISGSKDGSFTATYTMNTNTSQRIGTIVVTGGGLMDTVILIQDPAPILKITPSERLVSNPAGSTIFTITSNVSWSVTDDASWLTLSPSGDSGNGTLTAFYTENTTKIQRKGTITIRGGGLDNSVTVVQDPKSELAVSPKDQQVSYKSGSTTFTITTNLDWQVSDDAAWLTASPSSGSGNGTLTAIYTENTTTSQRVGTIIVSGNGKTDTVTVTQSESSLLTVIPSNRNVSYVADKITFAVTSNVNWSVSDDAAWLTVSPSSGSGNGTLTAVYTENTTASQRVGTIIVSGNGKTDTVTVTQSESSLLTVIPSNRNVSYVAGKITFAVTSNVNWSVSEDAAWLTVSPSSGSGNGTLTAVYTENTTASQRVGTIIVSGNGKTDTVTVTQSESSLLTVIPSNRNVSYVAGKITFAVTSNVNWSVSEDAAWLTVSPSSGSGNGTLTAVYTENTTASQRVGTIIVSGNGKTDTVTVTQSESSLLTVIPSNRNVSYESGQTTFAVTSNVNWSVSEDAAWLTVSPSSGSGNGTLTAVYTENTTASQRVGTIIVSGNGKADTVTVTQSESSLLTVIPSNRNVSYESGQTTFAVTSNVNWSVSEDAAWLTVSPSSGSGNGTLTAVYTENTTASQRVGTITVTGGLKSTVTIIQALKRVANIITSVSSLTDFGSVELGKNSAPQNYTVSGSNLTGDIEITSPAGFYISLNSSSNYTNKIILPQSDGSVPNTTILARLSPSELNAYSGSIIHTSIGAVQINVEVKGNGKINYPLQIPINVSYVFPDPAQVSNYKIIGLPGSNNIAIINILKSANIGSGDWRAFWDPGYGDYIEYDGSNLFNFAPGRAFWIISKNTININTNAESVNLSDKHSYPIRVHNEWNLISNPFDKTISWDEIRDFNPGINEPIYYFDSGNYKISDSLEQYKGYYFYNNPMLSITSINIPYINVYNTIPKKKITQDGGLEILLSQKGERISEIHIGFSDSAKVGLDYLDRFSPPPNFCEVSMALLNTSLSTHYKYLSSEFRPVIGKGQQYNIIVKNTTNEYLEFNVNGSDNFIGYELYIWDEESMKLYDLRKTTGIKVAKNTVNKEYRLFIGTEEYMVQIKKVLIPKEFKLFQNFPNPFNPSTKIMFSLPQQNKVSLEIFNVLGESIINLINDKIYEEGYHTVVFDGSKLSSGIYFYKILVGNLIVVKKMVLMK